MIVLFFTQLLATAGYVLGRSFQQLNCVHNRWIWLLPTSMFIATTEVYVITLIASATLPKEYLILSAGLGGTVGCVLAMLLSARLKERNMSKEPTASDYIYKDLLDALLKEEDCEFIPSEDHKEITLGNAEEIYDEVEEYFTGDYPSDTLYEIQYNYRDEGEECNLFPKQRSRHYEVDFVVKKIEDKWVGWNYWYGGGNHGEPEAIEWIGDAVFVNIESEEEVVQVVRTFSRGE